jgi:hypothetical protein
MRGYRAGLLVVLAAALTVGTAGSASGIAVPFEDGFEEVAVGTHPAVNGWWPLAGGKSGVVSDAEQYTGENSFCLDSWPWLPRMDYVWLEEVPDRLSYEAAVCVDPELGKVGMVGFMAGWGSQAGMWNCFEVDGTSGTVGFWGAEWVDLGAYGPNTWCTVRADLDFTTVTADLYVNQGEPVTVEIAPKEFYDPALGNVTSKMWGVGAPTYDFGASILSNVVYFDDVWLAEWSSTTTVEVEVKPGGNPNRVNLRSRGLLAVAILSSESFDATAIDPSTVLVAGAPVAVRGKCKCMAHLEEVDGDGLVDLVVQVEVQELDPVELEQGYAVVTGCTYTGEEFEGSDEVEIVRGR